MGEGWKPKWGHVQKVRNLLSKYSTGCSYHKILRLWTTLGTVWPATILCLTMVFPYLNPVLFKILYTDDIKPLYFVVKFIRKFLCSEKFSLITKSENRCRQNIFLKVMKMCNPFLGLYSYIMLLSMRYEYRKTCLQNWYLGPGINL
jgi:hypothetical protein